MVADAIDQRERLFGQPAGVEREYVDRQRVARDQVGEDHVLGPEAARENGGRMVPGDRVEQFPRSRYAVDT